MYYCLQTISVRTIEFIYCGHLPGYLCPDWCCSLPGRCDEDDHQPDCHPDRDHSAGILWTAHHGHTDGKCMCRGADITPGDNGRHDLCNVAHA